MALFTSYSIANDQEFEAKIDEALKAGTRLRTAFKLISADFFKSQQATFSNSPGLFPDYIDRVGGTSGANTPYAKRKIAEGSGNPYPMLVRSGRLRDSLTGNGTGDTINAFNDRSLVIGTKVEYGKFHQSDDTRTKLPLRKFLFIGPEELQFSQDEQKGRPQRWIAIIDAEIKRQLKDI